jgi:Putative lumazine-binding
MTRIARLGWFSHGFSRIQRILEVQHAAAVVDDRLPPVVDLAALRFLEAIMSRIVAVVAVAVLSSATGFGQASDEQEVRAVITQYFRGHATGDPAEMRKAFWPTAHIEGIREGKFVSWTAEEYCSRFSGNPAADESSRKRSIDRVEVSGTAAMAAATLVHGRTTFTDYFVLLKEGNTWKIANKVYSSRATN